MSRHQITKEQLRMAIRTQIAGSFEKDYSKTLYAITEIPYGSTVYEVQNTNKTVIYLGDNLDTAIEVYNQV